jgi:hypothetical protein
MPSEKLEEKVTRPVAVTLAGGLILLFTGASALRKLADLYQFWAQTGGAWLTGVVTPEGVQALGLILRLLLSVLVIILTIGLLLLKRRAWVGLMAVAGLFLFVNLAAYFDGQPDYPEMLLGTFVVFALSQAAIQDAFHVGRRPNEDLA